MQTVKVRAATVHGIFKEVGTNEDDQPYDIHITGFDAEGLPVRPVYEVPLTAKLSHAIYNEKRILDVTTREREALADVERLRAEERAKREKQGHPANNYIQLSAADLELRLEAARQEGMKAAQTKSK